MMKLGLIGCGKWAANYIRNVNDLKNHAQITRICSRTEKELIEEPANPYIFSTSPEDIFEDEEVGGVIISSPPISHFELVKQALRAGKHVLCEKPFVLTTANAQYLNDLAVDSKLTLIIDYIHLWNPFYQKIKQSVVLPEIENITFNVKAPRTGREHHSILYDWLSHDLAMVFHLFDKPLNNLKCYYSGPDILKSNVLTVMGDIGGVKAVFNLNIDNHKKYRDIIVVNRDGSSQQTFDTFEFNALKEVLFDFIGASSNNLAVTNAPLGVKVTEILNQLEIIK